MKTFRIKIYGADETLVHPEIKSISSSITYQAYDMDEMLTPPEITPDIILCYPPDEAVIDGPEIARTLRNVYSRTPLYFVSLSKNTFDKKHFLQCGYNQVFLLPWEKTDLIRGMNQAALCKRIPEIKDYKAVKLVDLKPNIVLDFTLKIYLPKVNRLLPFSLEGDPITEEKFKKLSEYKYNTLYIHNNQLDRFRRYTTRVFKKILSETDKQEKLEISIRNLLSDLFSEDSIKNTFEASQSMLNEVRDIIDILIEEKNKGLLEKIQALINQEQNFYQHLSNVATYGAIFAMALGLPNPEDVALAGLLHDIGKINLPPDIADIPEEELSPSGIEAYKKHPGFTIDIIKLRRIALPDGTIKAILQHHEAVNGSGYPRGIDGPRISKEGKVLAIANAFDNLTSYHPGRASITPRAALEKLFEDNKTGSMVLDLDMLKKLKALFID